jgi:hypothetical protein
VSYTYNALGQPTAITDGAGSRTFACASNLRVLAQETLSGILSGTLHRAYDPHTFHILNIYSIRLQLKHLRLMKIFNPGWGVEKWWIPVLGWIGIENAIEHAINERKSVYDNMRSPPFLTVYNKVNFLLDEILQE